MICVKRKGNEMPGDVYVGRPTVFGNPFVIGPDGTRDEVIAKFRAYFEGNEELKARARRELRGKNLVCYCAPLACHADVLLQYANE